MYILYILHWLHPPSKKFPKYIGTPSRRAIFHKNDDVCCCADIKKLKHRSQNIMLSVKICLVWFFLKCLLQKKYMQPLTYLNWLSVHLKLDWHNVNPSLHWHFLILYYYYFIISSKTRHNNNIKLLKVNKVSAAIYDRLGTVANDIHPQIRMFPN